MDCFARERVTTLASEENFGPPRQPATYRYYYTFPARGWVRALKSQIVVFKCSAVSRGRFNQDSRNVFTHYSTKTKSSVSVQRHSSLVRLAVAWVACLLGQPGWGHANEHGTTSDSHIDPQKSCQAKNTRSDVHYTQ